jgi:hypothetical protein
MKWLRFSIASLMAFISYAAVGLAALSKVGDPYIGRLWDDTYYMITVFALAIATIMAVLSTGRSRARWLGFAVFGWVHLLFGWPDSGGSPNDMGSYRPRFPHTTLVNWAIFSYLYPGTTHPWAVDQSILPPILHPKQGNYTWHVLQTSITMATAMIGAVVGHLLAIRVERQRRDVNDVAIRG